MDAGKWRETFDNGAMKTSAITGARHAAKMTLTKLSELTGISQSQLSRFESGGRNPRVRDIERIANALNVSAESLISEAALPAPPLTPLPVPPPEHPWTQVWDWMMEAAFEEAGIHPAEAAYLVRALREAADQLGSRPISKKAEQRSKGLARSLVGAVLPRRDE